MKRLLRRILIAVSASGIVLTFAIWARSSWVADTLVHGKSSVDGTTYAADSIRSERGRIAIVVQRIHYLDPEQCRQYAVLAHLYPDSVRGTWEYSRDDVRADQRSAGKASERSALAWSFEPRPRWIDQQGFTLRVALPYWLVAIVCAAPQAIPLFNWRRRRRRRSLGLCQRCGYNLRGLPSGHCPECGNWRMSSASPATAGR